MYSLCSTCCSDTDYTLQNAMLRAARTVDGRDVVIRVIRVGSEGQNQLDVLQCMARGPYSQATPNHAIPLFELFELEDITFGIFPRVGFSMADAYDSWAENSVGDVIDMVLQCLEALAFLHSMNMAHRDAFKDNFLVQWHPESLATDQLTISRPRVFLHDFETAVRFSVDVPPHERICTGLPLCPSFALPERYFRPVPPEVSSGNPYDPFKLDVWQFGISLIDFRTTIREIDDILVSLTEVDPAIRVSAYDALKSLAKVVSSIPPDRLNIAPVVIEVPLRDAGYAHVLTPASER
ncbi:uncharacterized protein TRAVEDRAFT_136543 [Trametes versicolor FP-101664 SS1]|uniref:Protein kinase domain-containing protein n=1 Tax=Trametes versicolor (strain FP-101664) TaxID=717944 RepID=R7S708_TRAVS|nr:uncharacterized protein TRAVEDRAFT_136543 [Trametes versicolor FP-101664 SS1]EIW51783.1 hypothetical protein TRAVEDRAFT_136543 [Trametes versicolor FP-101664 SS1]